MHPSRQAAQQAPASAAPEDLLLLALKPNNYFLCAYSMLQKHQAAT